MTKIKILLKFFIGAMIILLTLGLPSAGISVSPSIIEKEVDPGQHISTEIDISSSSDENGGNYIIEALGFGYTPEGGTWAIKADQDTSPYSARTFLNITPSNFYIEPGKSEKVLIEADVPKNVGEGGRYALIKIRSSPKSMNTTGASGASISVAFNIPVLFTIPGTKIITGEITSLKFSEPKIKLDGTKEDEAPLSAMQNITVAFKNTGNYHYKARAMAELQDESDHILTNATSSVSFNSIIPTFTGEFKLSLIPSVQLKPGSYVIKSIVSNADDGTEIASKEMKFGIKS